jgi:hypothetical protein
MHWYRKASSAEHVTLRSGMVIRPSVFHGHGAFPSRKHREGEIVYALVVPHPGDASESCRTEAARMTNHSSDPSMRTVRVGNVVLAIAAREVGRDDECTIDYRDVLPLLSSQPHLPAKTILRETPGCEHLVRTDGETTLFHQIADIASGAYR